MKRALLLALAVFVLGAPARAADPVVAVAVLDATRAAIGDAIQLTLLVDADAGYQVTDPGVPRTLGDFEVLEALRAQQDRRSSGATRLLFRYRVATYALGERALPAIEVRYVDPRGNAGVARTQPQAIVVDSVIGANDDSRDIRPLRPQIELPGGIAQGVANAVSAAAITGALALFVFVAVGLFLGRAAREAAAAPIGTPAQRAIAELERIEGLRLPAKGRLREQYELVASAVRAYLRDQFALPAHERTARELRLDLDRRGAEPRLAVSLGDVLRDAEISRFHRLAPYPRHAEDAARAALAALRKAAAAERAAIEEYEVAHVGGR